MATPNLVNVTTINGKTDLYALTTSQASVLAAAATGHVLKVNDIIVANKTTSAVTVLVQVYSAASLGGTAYNIANNISVPANASLIVTDKSTSFYVGEAQSVGASAGTTSAADLIISYEDLS